MLSVDFEREVVVGGGDGGRRVEVVDIAEEVRGREVCG